MTYRTTFSLTFGLDLRILLVYLMKIDKDIEMVKIESKEKLAKLGIEHTHLA